MLCSKASSRRGISFYTSKLNRLSYKTKEYLYDNLTLNSHSSLMRKRLRASIVKDVAITLRKEKKLIAWALITFFKSYVRVMTFVSKDYRKKGYGSILVQRSIRYIKKLGNKRIYALPWDKTSLYFFKSIGFKIYKYGICALTPYRAEMNL